MGESPLFVAVMFLLMLGASWGLIHLVIDLMELVASGVRRLLRRRSGQDRAAL